MDVEHRLPRRRAIELRDLHAVRQQFLDEYAGELLHHAHHLAQLVRIDIEHVPRRRVLRDHQRMPVGLREQVEEGEHVVVLVELVAGGIALDDLGEDVLRVVGAVQAHGKGLRSGCSSG
ncbi:hypothetical protein D9M68_868580 [compost metagenome]